MTSSGGGRRRTSWFRSFRRKFTALELAVLVIGAVLGFAGNAIYSERVPEAVGLVVLGVLVVVSVLSIDRLRFSAESEMKQANSDLQEELSKHLDEVHATVSFVSERGSNGGTRANKRGYDSATKAVRRARSSIMVIGDYSPPLNVGASFDVAPPAHRSTYLETIEEMLEKRLASGRSDLPVLQYTRFIQRPVDIYESARKRGATLGGITLNRSDMEGDEQAFEHCRNVLRIWAKRTTGEQPRISVAIRLIPFLPNCPSVLVVDQKEMQFTIPTRTDNPEESEYAKQGLMGLLAVEDKANGSQVVGPFSNLFSELHRFSTAVIGAESD